MEALSAFPRKLARAYRFGVTFAQLAIVLLLIGSGMAQPVQQVSVARAGDAQSQSSAAPVSLKDLIHEAEQNNPEIAAAKRAYTAATRLPRQPTALPTPHITT